MNDTRFHGTAEAYRQRARDVRTRAQTVLPEGRDKLLEIAHEWERLADEVEKSRSRLPSDE